MAAVTRVKARPCTPVGYEVVDKGKLVEDVSAGDLLTLSATGWRKAVAGTAEAHGIALQNGYTGQSGFSVGIQGEMDGFAGMTPGTALFPSATVAGGLDTTQPSGAVARVRAVTATRVRYNFV
jgi:hypothetical protein